MERNDAQYRTWLEFIGEVLNQPLERSLHYEEQLLHLLAQSFNGALSARNRVRNNWENRILACWPRDYVPDKPPGDYDFSQQPLLRWYAFTGKPEPQSFGRVPEAFASKSMRSAWEEIARPWNVNEQLSIPLQVVRGDFNTFLISRPDRDFTDQELDLARLLQPILSGLAHHLGFAPASNEAVLQCADHELTLREMAILSLLSKGLTASRLARQLGISPRTAEKHAEHIYRKLDVGDRLTAVRRAYQLGLLPPPDNLIDHNGNS